MEIKYLVVKEQIDDYDEWSPQTITTYHVAICETTEIAEKVIEKLKQDDADRFMDWLDECKEYIDVGLIDTSAYYDPDQGDFYFIEEVPFIKDAS